MRSSRVIRTGLVLAVTALGEPGAAWGVDPPDATRDSPLVLSDAAACDVSPETAPPDPRCGERLDGRLVAEPRPSVPKALLAGPRLLSRVVFWPVIQTGDFVEHHRLLWWMDALLTSDDGRVGVRPEIRYTTGFLPTAGARLFYRRLPPTGSEVVLRFLTAGPTAYLGEAEVSGPDWLGLGLRAMWNRRSDRLFAGIGAHSENELTALGRPPSRFGSDVLLTELRWSRPFGQRWSPMLTADLQRRDYRSDGVRGGPSVSSTYGLPADACTQMQWAAGCVDPALLPGFNNGLRLAHLGGGLGLDLRRKARDGGGLSLMVEGTYAHGVAGDPSRHLLLLAESLLAFGGNDRTFILRVRGAMVEKLGTAPVPFEELVSPSGREGMRGFSEGRFRGESGLVGSVEYRWFVAYNLDASLFVDVGTVAGPRFAGLDRDRVFPSFGIGVRRLVATAYYWRSPLQDGFQIAYAPDAGFKLLLTVAAF